jgi:hypothetical protein
MGLLSRRRSAFEQLENEIAGLRSRRDVLAGRLARADADIEQALSDRRRQLVEADPDQGNIEPIHVAQLRDTRDSFADAIKALDLRIVEAEERLNQERDRSKREAAARELNGVTNELTKLADDYAAVVSRLPAMLAGVIDKLPQAVVSKSHTEMFANEVLAALRMVVSEARSYAAQIVSGSAQICEPAQQPANPPAPAIERREVFLLVNGKWPELDGTISTSGAYTTCSPPASIAARAIEFGHGVDPLSDNAIVLHQRCPPRYGFFPPADCTDINEPKPDKLPAGSKTITSPPIHSEFARGCGGFATVARNPR